MHLPFGEILEIGDVALADLLAVATGMTQPHRLIHLPFVLSGSPDKSVLCFMKSHNLQFEKFPISVSIRLPFHGFDFVVCSFE